MNGFLARLRFVEATSFTTFDLHDPGFVDVDFQRAETQAADQLEEFLLGGSEFEIGSGWSGGHVVIRKKDDGAGDSRKFREQAAAGDGGGGFEEKRSGISGCAGS